MRHQIDPLFHCFAVQLAGPTSESSKEAAIVSATKLPRLLKEAQTLMLLMQARAPRVHRTKRQQLLRVTLMLLLVLSLCLQQSKQGQLKQQKHRR